MKHVTIKDIARYLTISVSTVSRALAGDKNIRRETKEAVLQAAEQLGYRPNPVARNLKAGRTSTVGVIVPEMVTPFASKVIDGIRSVLYPAGIKVIIADSYEDAGKERENLLMMERFMVDGIIISQCDYRRNHDVIMNLRTKGLPMVFYDRIPSGLDVSQVIVDDYMKAFFLTERLIRLGRRNIVHLQGPDRIYNSLERRKGYIDAMNKFRLPCGTETIIKCDGVAYNDGLYAADHIISSGMQCDAVFAFTDIVGIGVMNRLRQHGKKIPEEIAIASFSGTELSEMSYPPITTVQPPLFLMGKNAAELVLESISDFSSPYRSVVLNADIIMRASTDPTEHPQQL